MAKTFDPSQLSAADQSAFAQWQQQLRAYVAANGGGPPAPVTYALAHPEYLRDHPELQEGYDIVSGANLPPTVKSELKDYHPNWGSGNFDKNSGLWSKWETWLQIGLGGAVAYEVIPAIAAGSGGTAAGGAAAGSGGASAAGGATAATAPALEGGTTVAANLGASSALGPAAGAVGGTTAATVPALEGGKTLASNLGPSSAINGAGPAPAAASGNSFWDSILGNSKGQKIATGVSLGIGALGNYLQSRQVDKAVQAQVDAANKALDLQSNIYQQQRSDLAPYRNVGSASIGELSRLMGLPAGSDTTTPYFQQQAASQQATAQQNQQTQNRAPAAAPTQAVPRGTVASLGDGFVNMVSPDGRPARVPQAQVQSALAAGGRMA